MDKRGMLAVLSGSFFIKEKSIFAIGGSWLVKGDITANCLEANKIIKGRFAKPDEIADFIIYLTSDKAEYLTGQVYCFGSFSYNM